jgi:hypothetical protein
MGAGLTRSVGRWQPERAERRLVFVVGAVVFLDTLFYAVIAPLLPGLSHELRLSKLSPSPAPRCKLGSRCPRTPRPRRMRFPRRPRLSGSSANLTRRWAGEDDEALTGDITDAADSSATKRDGVPVGVGRLRWRRWTRVDRGSIGCGLPWRFGCS